MHRLASPLLGEDLHERSSSGNGRWVETNLFVQELLGGVGVALCTPNECQAVVHEGLIRVLIENAEENGLCFVGVTAHDFDDAVEGLNRKTRWVEGL